MTRRIFIAIPAPQEILEFLEKLKEDNLNVQGIKWMRPPNLHLTIYFIGNINGEDFEKIVNAVRPIINSHKKIILDFENIAFAPSQNPKMIWAKFQKNDSFTQLVNSIHGALSSIIPPAKFYYEEPIPHITLARFHPIKKTELINIERPLKILPIEIKICEIMESIPSTEGVKYIKTIPGLYLIDQ